VKAAELWLLTAVADEVDDAAYENDCRRYQHSGAQQLPDHSLEILVLYFRFSGVHTHML
jgi:hypothetical protein